MKGAKIILALLIATAVLVALLGILQPRERPANSDASRAEPVSPSATTPSPGPPPNVGPRAGFTSRPLSPTQYERPNLASEAPVASTNKVDKLAQIRETFRSLAGGDRTNALRTAKQLADANERETALLTLVTEWTHGELSSPGVRAQAIADHGLEAGLGMELAKNPDLAMLWANELTDGAGRAALLQEVARDMVAANPAAAFAMSDQVPESDRRNFINSVFTGWASEDTDAAIQWANQLPDPSDRDAAMQAIRTAAPVGIGTALRIQDGYPVVSDLVPGGPADLGGQLHVGDRIIALAGPDSQFVNTQNLSLQDIVQAIRGAPNTMLQLQIVPAGAAPDSSPQIISITRDQIKFKR